MGSAESSGGVYLELFSHTLTPGEEIQGVVHLEIKRPVNTSTLFLKFTGKERTQWTQTQTTQNFLGQSVNTSTTHRGKHYLIKQIFPIASFPDGVLSKGQFSYPFTIRTPSSLTNSFEVSQGTALGEIKYFLTAKLDRNATGIKSKATILVTREINPVNEGKEIPERRANVRTWCCLNRGEVSLRALIDKNAYTPGESVNIDVKVNNQACSIPVKGVRATLYRHVLLRDASNFSHEFKDTMNFSSIKCDVPGGKALLSVQNLDISVKVAEKDSRPFSAPTAFGSVLECSYTVEVEADMGGWLMCFGQRPKIYQGINIFRLAVKETEGMQAPENWEPEVHPMVRFIAGDQYTPIDTPVHMRS